MVYDTVREARAQWNPVWVVVDGSTDGTAAGLMAMAAQDDGLHVFALPKNQGKGAAARRKLSGSYRVRATQTHPRLLRHGFSNNR